MHQTAGRGVAEKSEERKRRGWNWNLATLMEEASASPTVVQPSFFAFVLPISQPFPPTPTALDAVIEGVGGHFGGRTFKPLDYSFLSCMVLTSHQVPCRNHTRNPLRY